MAKALRLFALASLLGATSSWLSGAQAQGLTPPIAQTLAPISDRLLLVFYYDATDTADPWKVYDPVAPPFASDLTSLEAGRGYWIKMSAPATMPLGTSTLSLILGWNLVGWPGYASATPTPRAAAWDDINDFLYQLQGLDLEAVGRSAYDLVVMDYSRDGTAQGEYVAADMAALKNSPGGPKRVLAYMSIGEAEDYRFYWQPDWRSGSPPWLDAENPDWRGNYKVRYWEPAWQGIIFGSPTSYLDRIIAAGFDGVYLDIIDAYQYYADSNPQAAWQMVDFVVAIARYARETQGRQDFGIFPQNGEGLATFPEYLATVTGIGREDTFYGYQGDNTTTPPSVTQEIEEWLDQFVAQGKLVLTIDYTTQQAQIDDAYRQARQRGYVPFCTVRALNRLTLNPGHLPD